MHEPARLPALAGAGLGELEARLRARAQLRSLVGKGAIRPHLALVRPPELAHASELHGFLLLGFGHVRCVRTEMVTKSDLSTAGSAMAETA